MDDDEGNAAAGEEVADQDHLDPLPGGRHSTPGEGLGKGTWLRTQGLTPADLAGKVFSTAQYKGGVGKTLLAYELAYLFGAILVDLDWDRGNASRAWGYKEENRTTSPLLDALERGRTPRPLVGGPWRPDLVPCSADFGENQPASKTLTDSLLAWAEQFGREYRCPVVVDTHPGAGPATYAAVAASHVVVAPVVLAERPMEATEGLVGELKSYRLLLVPNMVTSSPAERYIKWLQRLAAESFVPVGPAVSEYRWLANRSRRMAVCAGHPVPAKHRPLVNELHRVGEKVLHYAAA